MLGSPMYMIKEGVFALYLTLANSLFKMNVKFINHGPNHRTMRVHRNREVKFSRIINPGTV